MRSWPDLPPMASVSLTPEILAASDAVVIVTDHSSVDYEMVATARPRRRRHAGRLPDPPVQRLESVTRFTVSEC